MNVVSDTEKKNKKLLNAFTFHYQEEMVGILWNL